MNLICNTNLTTQAGGKCECRRDMRWNTEQGNNISNIQTHHKKWISENKLNYNVSGECQFYMDVDCSSVTYDTPPSTAVLTAVKKAETEVDSGLVGENIIGRTEAKNESLANSLLPRMSKDATDKELKEAFCRDIDSFSLEMKVAEILVWMGT